MFTSSPGPLPGPGHSKHLLHILGDDRGEAILLHILRLCPPEILAPSHLIMQRYLQKTAFYHSAIVYPDLARKYVASGHIVALTNAICQTTHEEPAVGLYSLGWGGLCP